MKKRIVQNTYDNGKVLYEVEQKWPILGWRPIYIDYSLYEAPAIFDSFKEAMEFIKPISKSKVKKIVVFEE